ncbi:MAG: hypothetical protein WC781_05455 [Candidatus Pacearchaeota archaeon]|jgi:hypothetical protein
MKSDKSLIGKRIITDRQVIVNGISLKSKPLMVVSVYEGGLSFLLNKKIYELKEKEFDFFQVMDYENR